MAADSKINKSEFILRISEESGLPVSAVNRAYLAAEMIIEDILQEDKKLALTGFGTFYKQSHKGHPVQFTDNVSDVKSYYVFKFSASHLFNKRLRQYDADPALYKEARGKTKEKLKALGEKDSEAGKKYKRKGKK